MLTSKSFVVVGETSHRDGKLHKTIADEVDKKINEFLNSTDGEYVDLKPSANISPGIGQDIVFVTIILKKKDEVKKDEVESTGFFRKKK
jgi:hypothetical protein